MKTLILPVAGRSSRFPGMRPKWLLTMPDGKIMLEKAVEKLTMSDYDRVVVVCLEEHLVNYLSIEAFESIIHNLGHHNVDSCILKEATSSQSETISLAIQKANIRGAFFVKDCDNMFDVRWRGGNEVAVLDIHNTDLVDAKSKSYVDVDALGYVTNIVEKHVISNYFCCGGYGFEDSENFLRHLKSIKSQKEVYLSHVIYSMLLEGENFQVNEASNYFDWGTLTLYRQYMKSFITVFCDVDGVLLINGSKFGKKGWTTEPISENLEVISQLQSSGLIYLVITSSRPESQKDYVRSRLAEHEVYPDQYVMDLPHTRRILVNDFSSTNPFPSAVSVNLERDSKLLSSILGSMNI